MQKILVSACMAGQKVRYDASDVETGDGLLERWREEGRLVTFCPELAGGFPVPRPPAEIEGGRGGDAVLDAGARVFENAGGDVTGYFREGAEGADAALRAARAHRSGPRRDDRSSGAGRRARLLRGGDGRSKRLPQAVGERSVRA